MRETKAHMNGRRSHARFFVASNEGVLKAAWDVTVVAAEGVLFAFSAEPAVVGDALTIELITKGGVEQVAVRVEESLPVIDAGTIRHRIRLARVAAGARTDDRETGNQRSRCETDRIPPGGRRRTSRPD